MIVHVGMWIIGTCPKGAISLRFQVKVSIPVLSNLRKVLSTELIDFRFPTHHTIEAHWMRRLFIISFISRDILRRTLIGLLRIIELMLRVANVL